jgi:hypothetical protein
MKSLLEKRRNWFTRGSTVRIRTLKSELVGEVVDMIGENTLSLIHFHHVTNGYVSRGGETYCIPMDHIFWFERVSLNPTTATPTLESRSERESICS